MADECLDLSEALKSSEEMQGGSCAGGRQLELLHHAYSFCGTGPPEGVLKQSYDRLYYFFS